MLGCDDINEGKFIVIKSDNIIDLFRTYVEALEAAYEQHGLGPLLVKKIERNETVLSFSRNLR
jgi:hypothetical protein